MRIHNLYIENIRNIRCLSFKAANSINFFHGFNGAGKSSILEALYFLSCGRSFRTHKSKEIISWNKDDFIIRASFSNTYSQLHNVGLQKSRKHSFILKLDEEKLRSASELAKLLPIRVIHPELHELISGGPSIRRKFIDWGVFHVEPIFHLHWKNYQYVLRQRNELLKTKFNQVEFRGWNVELAKTGEIINGMRMDYIKGLKPFFEYWLNRFKIGNDISISFKQGWENSDDLLKALEKSEATCLKRKATTVGPHRADLFLNFNGVNAKQIVSRGQQKLLVFALVFSQIALYKQLTGDCAVLLCDDPDSELDLDHRLIFISAIRELDLQCFMTGNSKKAWQLNDQDSLFHVNHGII